MANKTMYCDDDTARRIADVLYKKSLQEWSTLLDVEKDTINNYIRGRTQLKIAQLKLICEATNTSADWILGLK